MAHVFVVFEARSTTRAVCRCSEVGPRLSQEQARGRSSSNGGRYMRALHTLREVLCIVQQDLGGTTRHILQHAAAEFNDTKVSRLVQSLAVQAAEVRLQHRHCCALDSCLSSVFRIPDMRVCLILPHSLHAFIMHGEAKSMAMHSPDVSDRPKMLSFPSSKGWSTSNQRAAGRQVSPGAKVSPMRTDVE